MSVWDVKKTSSSNRSMSGEQWRCSVRGKLYIRQQRRLITNEHLYLIQICNTQMCNMVTYFCFTAWSGALHFPWWKLHVCKNRYICFFACCFFNCTSEYSVTYHVISFLRAANPNLNACHQPQVSLSLIAQYESVRANAHSLTSNRSLCCLHGFLTAGAHTTCTVHVRNMQPFFLTSPSGSSVHLRWLAGHTDPWHVRAGPVPPCPLLIEWASALWRLSCLVGYLIPYMSSFPRDGVQGMFNLVAVL